MRRLIGAFGFCVAALLAGPVWAQEQPPTGEILLQGDGKEQVVVLGEREGPRIWRVINGEHELIIFGTLSPLPKGVTWRSETIERLVADADAIIPARLTISADIGFFKALSLLNTLRKERKNDKNVKLVDLVSPQEYARFSALRARYGQGSDAWEKLRPLAAGAALASAAFEDIGVRNVDVTEQVQKIAKKAKRPWKQVSIKFEGDLKAVLLEASANAGAAELECFRETLDRVEGDLPLLRQRANAWAAGDVERLRALGQPPERKACEKVARGSPVISELLDRGLGTLREEVDRSFLSNRSTLWLQPIDTVLFGPLLQNYAEKGFQIEGPWKPTVQAAPSPAAAGE